MSFVTVQTFDILPDGLKSIAANESVVSDIVPTDRGAGGTGTLIVTFTGTGTLTVKAYGVFNDQSNTSLPVDTVTGSFTTNKKIVGGTSGATALVYGLEKSGYKESNFDPDTLILRNIYGTFQDNETVTQDDTGATCQPNIPNGYTSNYPTLYTFSPEVEILTSVSAGTHVVGFTFDKFPYLVFKFSVSTADITISEAKVNL